MQYSLRFKHKTWYNQNSQLYFCFLSLFILSLFCSKDQFPVLSFEFWKFFTDFKKSRKKRSMRTYNRSKKGGIKACIFVAAST